MADLQTSTTVVTYSLTMERGNESETRTISFDYNKTVGSTTKNDVGAVRTLLLGDYNKLVQPAGWRDSDDTEEEFVTVSCEAKIVQKVETTLDFGANNALLSKSDPF